MKRSSGILMHVTSLSSPFGIGTFGKEAYEFIDFLKKAGQSYWQILPLGPTGYGNSPYQCFSAFAGNPYFIDFNLLKQQGYLNCNDYENLNYSENSLKVDYESISINKFIVLKKAFLNGKDKEKSNVINFYEENKEWLEDYAFYMALKNEFKLLPWQSWPEDIKFRRESAMEIYRKKLKDEINYWVFIQYIFYKQWNDLKSYANSNGIKIIGDIPMYISIDSADAWANSSLFNLDENKNPIMVSGCPPDSFSKTGQLWGNPIYDWEYIISTKYIWWINRFKNNFRLYDMVRIDHFRGFISYWQVPFGDSTAINGSWIKGPAFELFETLKNAFGDSLPIIAEDLGFLTKEVIDFREAVEFPGMRVLQFAFNPKESSCYLPHKYINNTVVYTGTHDNDTVMGWLENSGEKQEVNYAVKYLKLNKQEGYNWGFIRGAWSSVADLAIAQMQDFIAIGSQGRMNIPSTTKDNWTWRIEKNLLTNELAEKIYDITRLYERTMD